MRSRWPIIASVLILLFLAITFLIYPIDPINFAPRGHSPQSSKHKPITHLVLLEFKPDTKPSTIRDVSTRMMELKDKCIHPILEKPYITSIRGGKNNSPQDLEAGLTHAFIIEFVSVEHRDYYIEHDPAHKAFKSTLPSLLENPQIVVDFTDGKFT